MIMFKGKGRKHIPNINKETLRFQLLDKVYSSKDNILNYYSYKYTKYDPIFVNINISKSEYKKYIEEIDNITISSNVEKDIKGNNIILSFNTKCYTITKSNYYRIKNQIIDSSFQKYITFDTLVWCLLNRYSYFNMLNGLMGSVLPDKYLQFGSVNEIFECFGSFLNHTSKYYCGLFYDLERYFGNVGNFFDTKFKSGLFFANPPFTIDMINKVCIHISKIVNNKLTFILILPTWRIEDRIKLNKVCKSKLRIDYKTDVDLNPVLNSDMFKSRYLYCKEDFPYYDFVDETSRNFASTDVIVIGSKNIDILKIFPNDSKII